MTEEIKKLPEKLVKEIGLKSSAVSIKNFDGDDYIFLDSLFEILAKYQIKEKS